MFNQVINLVVIAHQWKIIHGVHNNTLVLRSVFCHSPEARFQNVISIQKRLFSSWFHPDFILERKRFYCNYYSKCQFFTYNFIKELCDRCCIIKISGQFFIILFFLCRGLQGHGLSKWTH